MVKEAALEQPDALFVALIVIVAEIALAVVLVAENCEIVAPLPDAARPIAVFEFVHE